LHNLFSFSREKAFEIFFSQAVNLDFKFKKISQLVPNFFLLAQYFGHVTLVVLKIKRKLTDLEHSQNRRG
jgi:hypothetical protein